MSRNPMAGSLRFFRQRIVRDTREEKLTEAEERELWEAFDQTFAKFDETFAAADKVFKAAIPRRG